MTRSGDTVTVPYTISGSSAGSATHVSVLMTDGAWDNGWGSGEVKYYEVFSRASEASDAVTFALPSNYDAGWNVYLLAETVNGEKETDTASAPVALTVPAQNAPDSTPTPAPEDDKHTAVIGDDTSKADAASITQLLENKTSEELAEITTAKIENASSLESLSGIEKLENLETLSISGADKLTDISGVNALKNLRTLDVSGCAALEAADLSGNTSLTEVSVSECGALKELDVSNCPALESLDVSEGALEALEVSGCARLRTLDCRENRLGRLDAGGLANLATLRCERQRISGWRPSLVVDLGVYVGRAAARMASAAVTLAGVEKVLDVKAYDSAEREVTVTYDSGSGTVTFSSLPDKMVYWYDTGFNAVSMDVTVMASGDDNPTSNRGGGGCDSGLSGGLALFALIALRQKRK